MKASARYYASHPAARKVKAKKDTEINKRPEQIKKRIEANAGRAAAKKRGVNIKGKDYDHAVKKMIKTSTNRGRKGEGNR